MSLSPEWQSFLRGSGFEAVHWSAIGAYNAPDTEIMRWAHDDGWVVFTHDLDFGILLAHSRDGRPSVIQVRTQDVSPKHLGSLVLRALYAYGEVLESGALLTIDEFKARVRILPL
jgi:predicted nuclease of predicted toxin-antitoxin system